MPTNRQRTARQAKRRIAANVTREYLEELEGRDFLAECSGNIYGDGLSQQESELLSEYKLCNCDFKKWQKREFDK